MTDNESSGTGESSDTGEPRGTGESRGPGSDEPRSGQMGVDASHAPRTAAGPSTATGSRTETGHTPPGNSGESSAAHSAGIGEGHDSDDAGGDVADGPHSADAAQDAGGAPTVLMQTRAMCATHPGRPMVLRDVDLRLHQGVRVAILGANGSGKTTLLRCLSGSLEPVSGEVLREGKRLEHNKKALREHRRVVQHVLQDPDDQLFSADVFQDVSFGPMNMGLDEDEVRERVTGALTLLGADHLAERATHQLSYGERKRVAVAGAMAMRPKLLMLDEPTAGLDPDGVSRMMAALGRLHQTGTTVAMATHDVDLALAWADEALVVVDHSVVQGPIDEMLADSDIVERAHLHLPWALDLAQRMGVGSLPRTMDEVVAALKAR